ncbi:hypothetical protein PDQ75_24985 [Bacillus cereus group sp. Bc015]|uniref:hypothetical protein n=1 Tax=Bacillus cereus group sp. Bc015 TaxID=3018123 RepID=UPI0022E21DBC|nr:hypothetical protein [Bacillus cereus group sp. Bc015]MDA2738412.1 hypothetical protein [Bacillus cereus group sp. Bc015]
MNKLQVATTGSEYSYWEVFRFGQDKDIFEIVETGVERFKGLRVVMKQVPSGLVMKHLNTYDTDNGDDIVVPFGGITGATFKRVETYEPISLPEALEELKNDKRNVYIKDIDGKLNLVSQYAVFERIGIVDFNDLFSKEFFIKK